MVGCDWCFDPSLFRRVVVTSAVRCCTVLLLFCFLIVGIHASGISIPPCFFSPMIVDSRWLILTSWIMLLRLLGYHVCKPEPTHPGRSSLRSRWKIMEDCLFWHTAIMTSILCKWTTSQAFIVKSWNSGKAQNRPFKTTHLPTMK